MPLFRSTAVPTTPTLPKGLEVASFERYLDAQQAVDHLSDEEFPVQHVTIVGTDLHMVERITGRLTYARVAGAGAMSGAWFGLMISLLYWLFMPEGSGFPLLAGILIGAAFGMLFGVVSYALTGGKRDFTSSSQVVAGRYAIVCAPEHVGRARELLRGTPVRSAAPGGASNPYAGPSGPYERPAPQQGDGAAPPQQPAGPQGAPPQSAPPQAAPPQGAPPQATPPQADRPQPAPADQAADRPAAEGRGGPSRFGSRPDEAPRYGVRITPEQPQDDGRDGERS